MFYAEPLLVRKGQFSHLWLAAHWEKKLTKAHVVETDVVATVRCLLDEPVKLALRTSGHLLLGVVRIFARKLKYLLSDCNEVHVKIKVAFRPGVIDLPADQGKDGLLLPDLFSEFDMGVADLSDIDWQAKFAMNQARDEDITLPPTALPQAIEIQQDEGDFGELNEDSRKLLAEEFKMSGEFDMGVDMSTKDFLQGDSDLGVGSKLLFEQADKLQPEVDFMDVDQPPVQSPPPAEVPIEEMQVDTTIGMDLGGVDETTLVQQPKEAFVLEPLNVSGVLPRPVPMKRKRALMVDDQLQLTNDQIRENLRDTSDIVQPCPLAPRSKRAALLAEHGSAESLFTKPSSILRSVPGSAPMLPAKLMKFYRDNCRAGASGLDSSANKSLPSFDASTEELRAGADQTSEFRIGDDTTLTTMNEPPPMEFEREEMAFEQLPPEQEELPLEPIEESLPSKRRQWANSTSSLLAVIRREASDNGSVTYDQICQTTFDKKEKNVSARKNAARVFQSILLLVREGNISLSQDQPFEEITATIKK